VALLLAAVGAAWYQNLVPWLPRPKKLFPSTAANAAAHAVPLAPQKTTSTRPDSGKSPQTSEALLTPPNAALQDALQPASPDTAKPSELARHPKPAEATSTPDAAIDAKAVKEKPEVAANAGKRSASLRPSKTGLISAAPASDRAVIMPPKLIKSVRAIASPNALQDFARGNGDGVTVDALVDTSGHVKSMKVLSGAASLRSSAMEALKQYRYELATRRGKPVPAHVTVKIKFLFEP
jgi:TonB family protein